LRDLEATGIPEPENIESMSVPEIYESDHFKKRVRWPCAKCGKVFYAHCGLYISPEHGPVLPDSSRSQNLGHHDGAASARRPMDRLSCGTCKHFRDVGYQHWGECTAPAPRWAWGEYIETTRQVFRDGSAADLAPDCEAYKPNAEVSSK
jgi:ribosomal protein S27AE